MLFEYDSSVDAVYIQMRSVPFAYEENLDNERRVHYGTDGKPIGVELLAATSGVNLDGLPNQDEIGRLLTERNIAVSNTVFNKDAASAAATVSEPYPA